MLETETETNSRDAQDTMTKISQFRYAMEKYNNKHRIKSFHTKDSKKQKTGNDGGRGAGGGADDAGSTDCVELEAHGYEVEPREMVDKNGYVIMESFSNVRQPHSTYAPR